jgi:hypothetical protein
MIEVSLINRALSAKAAALDSMPREFRSRIRNVAVMVADTPTSQPSLIPERGMPASTCTAKFSLLPLLCGFQNCFEFLRDNRNACLFFQGEIEPYDLVGFRENGPVPVAHLSHEEPPNLTIRSRPH